jgi:hypothetical protein
MAQITVPYYSIEDDLHLEVTVDYDYIPYESPTREYPGNPEGVEIMDYTTEPYTDSVLDARVLEAIVLATIAERHRDRCDERAAYLYETRREAEWL